MNKYESVLLAGEPQYYYLKLLASSLVLLMLLAAKPVSAAGFV